MSAGEEANKGVTRAMLPSDIRDKVNIQALSLAANSFDTG